MLVGAGWPSPLIEGFGFDPTRHGRDPTRPSVRPFVGPCGPYGAARRLHRSIDSIEAGVLNRLLLASYHHYPLPPYTKAQQPLATHHGISNSRLGGAHGASRAVDPGQGGRLPRPSSLGRRWQPHHDHCAKHRGRQQPQQAAGGPEAQLWRPPHGLFGEDEPQPEQRGLGAPPCPCLQAAVVRAGRPDDRGRSCTTGLVGSKWMWAWVGWACIRSPLC